MWPRVWGAVSNVMLGGNVQTHCRDFIEIRCGCGRKREKPVCTASESGAMRQAFQWVCIVIGYIIHVDQQVKKKACNKFYCTCYTLYIAWRLETYLPGCMRVTRLRVQGDFSTVDWNTKSVFRPILISSLLYINVLQDVHQGSRTRPDNWTRNDQHQCHYRDQSQEEQITWVWWGVSTGAVYQEGNDGSGYWTADCRSPAGEWALGGGASWSVLTISTGGG